MSHTPEPWEMSKPYGGEAGGTCVAITGVISHYFEGVNYNSEEEQANAERIVACVNACEGINPEAVGEMLKMLVKARMELKLREMNLEGNDQLIDPIDDLIAKAKEGQS